MGAVFSSNCIGTSRRRDESKKLLKRRRKNGSSTYLYCDVADAHSNEMRHFLISLDERKREMDPPPSGAWQIKINGGTLLTLRFLTGTFGLLLFRLILFLFIWFFPVNEEQKWAKALETGGKKSRSFKVQRNGRETVLEERLNLEIRCKL